MNSHLDRLSRRRLLTLGGQLAAVGWARGKAAALTAEDQFAAAARGWLQLLDPESGLPVDIAEAGLDGRILFLTESPAWMKTSPTVVGLGLVVTVLLRDRGILTADSALRLAERMVDQLERMERHESFWCTWYDVRSARSGSPGISPHLPHFVSSVDNSNLTAALHIVEAAFPATSLSDRATALLQGQDYRRFVNPANGLIRLGWFPDTGAVSPFDYGTLNTEARLLSLFGLRDGAPATVWTEMDDCLVFASDRDGRLVPVLPSWGGSLFETLMVEPLINGASLAPQVWQENARRMLRLHATAAEERGWPIWGWSPAFDAFGFYREYGVPALSATDVLAGYPMGAVSPYSAALGLRFEPELVLHNLAQIRALNPEVYHPEFGYRDTIDPETGAVTRVVSALDKAMEALGLSGGSVEQYFWASLERRGKAAPLRGALAAVTPLPPIEADPWSSAQPASETR